MCCLVEWVEESPCKINLPLELLWYPIANVLHLNEGTEVLCQPEAPWLGGWHEAFPSEALRAIIIVELLEDLLCLISFWPHHTK